MMAEIVDKVTQQNLFELIRRSVKIFYELVGIRTIGIDGTVQQDNNRLSI